MKYQHEYRTIRKKLLQWEGAINEERQPLKRTAFLTY